MHEWDLPCSGARRVRPIAKRGQMPSPDSSPRWPVFTHRFPSWHLAHMIWRIVLYVVASWLLAAHFLRAGELVLTVLCLTTPLLFFVRRRWSLLTLQGLSFVAAAVWLATTWQIVEMRRLLGQPWLRAAIILIAVAGFNVAVGLLLRGLRARYPAEEPGPDGGHR